MATSTAGGRELPRMPGTVADLGVSVAAYPQYAQAQRALDYLSDNRFPVAHASIVGSDLSVVETVPGRMTTARAARRGAAAGSWLGLFIGVMFGLFSNHSWWGVVAAGVGIGGVWGAIFGAVARAGRRGVGDFIARGALAAGSYEVLVGAGHAEQARSMLAHLPVDK
jgi:Heat induced stress protein YflT domain